MSASGLSAARLRRLGEVLTRHVESGGMPGLVAMVARRGEVHVEAIGTQAFQEVDVVGMVGPAGYC